MALFNAVTLMSLNPEAKNDIGEFAFNPLIL
jgi:hypothetical protein